MAARKRRGRFRAAAAIRKAICSCNRGEIAPSGACKSCSGQAAARDIAAARRSLRGIAAELQKLSIVNERGAMFSASSVASILLAGGRSPASTPPISRTDPLTPAGAAYWLDGSEVFIPPTIPCRVFFGTRFACRLFRRFRFSDFAFLFLGIFSEGAACCIRFHVSHHVKAAKLVAMVPALRHYFSGFLAAYNNRGALSFR